MKYGFFMEVMCGCNLVLLAINLAIYHFLGGNEPLVVGIFNAITALLCLLEASHAQ